METFLLESLKVSSRPLPDWFASDLQEYRRQLLRSRRHLRDAAKTQEADSSLLGSTRRLIDIVTLITLEIQDVERALSTKGMPLGVRG